MYGTHEKRRQRLNLSCILHIGQAARVSLDKAKELNEKYHITERSKSAVENTIKAAVEYNNKHNIR